MLHIKNACKKLGGQVVFYQLNLEIKANTIVGLAGASGSGKSTLLRCMQRLETLDQGQIEMAGDCGFMFQDFQLFPHMTVLNNLTYAPIVKKKPGFHVERAFELLKTLGLEDKAHAYPNLLSGGQKQRVALARALMMQPNLLLCDEPTSGLDMGTVKEVVGLLKTIKAMGVTMVVASHDLGFLAQLAERVVVLKSGNLVADVPTAHLEDPLLFLKQFYEEEFL